MGPRPILPSWTKGLPPHTLLCSTEVSSIFGLPLTQIDRAIERNDLPKPTETRQLRLGQAKHYWALSDLRKHIRSIL